ncbi:hypothetical protein N7474_001581 [Penicillium riverlandense]|uniref:uncharacterized protein n=1 Tax=Penicillium riverlandense TaxID=1903569 RepID=UPI0025499E54|nr:uncharacterized protein N7474_001581 [Penicillium riverlandense]KAJ5833270.1 hypothetical protein N7474_001581 [Penicillium riverlandense]
MSTVSLSTSRHRFALLGATGHTGRLILKKLLQQTSIPDIEVQVYVRSRQKLESLVPSISSDNRVSIFEGHLEDEGLIRNCVSGVDTIFCTIGENENIPGVTVLQDTAQAILTALSSLQKQSILRWTRPRLIMLSSATWNARFAATRPIVLDWMIRNAFAHPYHDLVEAQKMLLDASPLLRVLLVQPNALVREPASGCVISTEFAAVAVSYEDLAEGFVQISTNSEFDGIPAVGVSSARAENYLLYIPFVLGKVLRGLLFKFVPGYWQAEYAVSRYLASWTRKIQEVFTTLD